MDRATLSLFIDQLARYIGNTIIDFAHFLNIISKQKYINSLLTLHYFVRIRDFFYVTLCVRYSSAHILFHFFMLHYVLNTDTDTVMHISYCTLA